MSRTEEYYKYLATGQGSIPKPLTREEQYLYTVCSELDPEKLAFAKNYSEQMETLVDTAEDLVDQAETVRDSIPEDYTTLSNDVTELKEDLKNHITVNSAVGGMLEVAEGYFNQAYGANTHLVYDSTHGLFAPQTTSSVSGEEGYPAIVCSQFAQALMMGIHYNQSRYVTDNNHLSDWGYTTDGSGTYVYTSSDMSDLPSQDYMIAKQQLKYAIDHGWSYEITDVRRQVRPGDFIFYGLSGVSSWEDITHVALALHVGLDDGYMITLESDDQTANNKSVLY